MAKNEFTVIFHEPPKWEGKKRIHVSVCNSDGIIRVVGIQPERTTDTTQKAV